MRITFLLVCGIALLVLGCGKNDSAPSSATQPDATSVAGSSAAPNAAIPASTQPPVQQTYSAAQNVSTQPAVVPADASAALGILTDAVRKYSAEKQKVPKTLSEVVSAGYVRNMPKAPAGKKFAINPKRVEVTLVNQ